MFCSIWIGVKEIISVQRSYFPVGLFKVSLLLYSFSIHFGLMLLVIDTSIRRERKKGRKGKVFCVLPTSVENFCRRPPEIVYKFVIWGSQWFPSFSLLTSCWKYCPYLTLHPNLVDILSPKLGTSEWKSLFSVTRGHMFYFPDFQQLLSLSLSSFFPKSFPVNFPSFLILIL